jgi:site-specific DNA-methyltransferase (adenine-specific)
MLETNKIYQGDCLEMMKQIEDKSIDVAILDPPYPNGKELFKDNIYDAYACIYSLCKKVKKRIVFFWSNHRVPIVPDGWFEIAHHIWHKPNGNSATYYENIIVWAREDKKSVSKVFRIGCINSIVSARMCKDVYTKHPTQKPLELIKQLVELNTKKDDLILDCFAGSGTTLIACKELKRNFIGIELAKEYFEIAEERLKEENSQTKLNSEVSIPPNPKGIGYP